MNQTHRSGAFRGAWLAPLVLLLLLLLLAVGCGGDDDADPTATASGGSQSAATATDEPASDPTATEEAAGEPSSAPTEEPSATGTDEAEPTATDVEPTASDVADAPEPELPVTVTDIDGEEVTISDVSRIIPLNGDIAEIVFALGLGDNVVAVDTSATYPEDVNALPRIGYQRQLAAEGILALSPTLVIGNELAGPPEVLEQLESAGVTVVIFPDVTTIEGIPDKIQAIAAALGVPAAGEQLAAETLAEIEAAQELAASVDETRSAMFLYVRGATTQLIGGSGTTADAMIVASGATNAAAAAGIVDYQPMTAESLAAAQPDLLILLTAGLESVGGPEGLLEIPGVAQTPAAQNGAVIDFDDLYFLGFGPRTGEALHDLIVALHPELET
jgi:iron complex transport system substrate-binding protein